MTLTRIQMFESFARGGLGKLALRVKKKMQVKFLENSNALVVMQRSKEETKGEGVAGGDKVLSDASGNPSRDAEGYAVRVDKGGGEKVFRQNCRHRDYRHSAGRGVIY